jgi:hypothetical protein
MPLTTYPVNRVHGPREGNYVYYIRTQLYRTPMRCWHVLVLTRRPPCSSWHDTFGLHPPSSRPRKLSPTRSPGPSSSNLSHPQLPAKHDGASFMLFVGVTYLESQLAVVAWGSLHLEAKARPQQLLMMILFVKVAINFTWKMVGSTCQNIKMRYVVATD